MKNIKAFLAAILLFAVTAGGIHFAAAKGLPEYHIRYGTWIQDEKFASKDGLATLLKSSEAIPVFGSSELKHGRNTIFAGSQIFQGSDMKPVYIGQAGYQSLTHALTAGALGKTLSGRKAVLIVSPQWFKKGGVKKNAFQAAFSEDIFIEFLKNENLSKETRDYGIRRAKELVKGNDSLLERIQKDIRRYPDSGEAPGMEAGLHEFWVKERANTGLFVSAGIFGMNRADGQETEAGRRQAEIDWDSLVAKAEQRGKKLSASNDFGMYDEVYERNYRDLIQRGEKNKPSYCTDSEEFEDLEFFLKVCGENRITPLVLLLPFNGYWYDYLGLGKEERTALYDKTRKLAADCGAQCADLSGNEYTSYYFEDNSHPALKGLVEMNEAVYDFYKEL